MAFQVTVLPSKQQFSATSDETLLNAALRAGVGLPYGCKNGACGACKVKVLQGEVTHQGLAGGVLSEVEQAAGQSLLCCAYAHSDIVLESKTVSAAKDMVVKTFPTRVQQLVRVSEDVMVVQLQLPASEKFTFLAGQYIDILLKDGSRRSFSLANAPEDNGLLELHIRHTPGGKFTEHVFNALQPRDILRINGPLGSFFLRDDSEKPVILLASGTGFAPVKAMLEHAFAQGSSRPFILYWGAYQRKHFYLTDLPQQWQMQHTNFRFIPVLSDPIPEDAWEGRVGLVHEAVLADFPSLAGYEVYACGSPKMVEVAHQTFIQDHGLAEDDFYSDAFFFAAPTPPSAS